MPVISDQEPAHQRLFDVPPGSNFQLNLLRNLGDSLETPRCCLLSKVAADYPSAPSEAKSAAGAAAFWPAAAPLSALRNATCLFGQ